MCIFIPLAWFCLPRKQINPFFSFKEIPALCSIGQSGKNNVSVFDNMCSAAVSLCDIRRIALALNYMMCRTIAIRRNYLAAERKLVLSANESGQIWQG